VDTYLRFAEACNRLDLEAGPRKSPGLPDVVGEITESGARGKSDGALAGAAQSVADAITPSREEDRAESKSGARRATSRRKGEQE
jgi:hypothetical protein